MTAEDVLRRVIAARLKHPECDVHADDAVTCGWKRVVLDIDAALKAVNRDELIEEAERGNRVNQERDHRGILAAGLLRE